jgi:hypothetical protein
VEQELLTLPKNIRELLCYSGTRYLFTIFGMQEVVEL